MKVGSRLEQSPNGCCIVVLCRNNQSLIIRHAPTLDIGSNGDGENAQTHRPNHLRIGHHPHTQSGFSLHNIRTLVAGLIIIIEAWLSQLNPSLSVGTPRETPLDVARPKSHTSRSRQNVERSECPSYGRQLLPSSLLPPLFHSPRRTRLPFAPTPLIAPPPRESGYC